jgi:hypothetical protein
VSIDYYVRMERGNLAGASDAVLDGVASALQLDEAERAHLFDLARAAQPVPPRHRRAKVSGVTDGIQQILDAITDAPAWVRNARHGILAANRLARALYAPALAGPRRPANNARFVYLDPAAHDFFADWERAADDIAAMLRSEAGSNPRDKQLIELIGELEFPAHPGLTLLVYTAAAGTTTADSLRMLASWAATAEQTGDLPASV